MEDAPHRWSVTYTKHVKQKRKVYQDGFLELKSSSHKVMLYDEWDKILESRLVKKEDVIKSGETLAFDSYLVDIGDIHGGHKPTSTLNCEEKNVKVSEKSGSSLSYGSQSNAFPNDKTPMFRRSKGGLTTLSPSVKMIRDFKKSEMNKCGSSPNCIDIPQTSTTEWQVLYTTQITQKAKKFHDGFLQLVVRGSQGRQVKLYDTNRRQLDGRFLKKDEIVISGESLALEGHLVEIGEQEGDHKPVTDSTIHGKDFKAVEKIDIADNPAKFQMNKKFPAGKFRDKTSTGEITNLHNSGSMIENAKLSWINPVKPRRAVHDILSILRQPIQRKVVTLDKPLVENCLELHSMEVHSGIKNLIRGYAEESNILEELREKPSDNNCIIKVLQPEVVEVLNADEKRTVSENGGESQARSSSFNYRSATTNCTTPIIKVECNDRNKLMSSSSMLATPALDPKDQRITESASLTRSNENEEPENPPEIRFCEETRTDTNAVAPNGSKFSELLDNKRSSSRCHKADSSVSAAASNHYISHDLSGVDEETPKQDLRTKEMAEFPSFDLGF